MQHTPWGAPSHGRCCSDDTGVLVKQAKAAVDSLFSAMRESIIRGDRIEIRGFGVFAVKNTNPKPNARNPKTGERISVPARRKVSFKPGKLVKEALKKPI